MLERPILHQLGMNHVSAVIDVLEKNSMQHRADRVTPLVYVDDHPHRCLCSRRSCRCRSQDRNCRGKQE